MPRLLAMLCILAVFVPAFFMEGAARALFAPLALAVGFAMIASYILSSTFVPVLSVWLLRHSSPLCGRVGAGSERSSGKSLFDHFRGGYEWLVRGLVAFRWLLVPAYLVLCGLLIWTSGPRTGPRNLPGSRRRQIPPAAAGPRRHAHRPQRAVRQAGPGARSAKRWARKCRPVARLRRHDPLELSGQRRLSMVARAGGSHPVCRSLADHAGSQRRSSSKNGCAKSSPQEMPGVRCSFEPADIVNEVMSFGSPDADRDRRQRPEFRRQPGFRREGPRRAGAAALHARLAIRPVARLPDDRGQRRSRKGGPRRPDAADVSRSLVTATSSSRFMVPNYWADPKTASPTRCRSKFRGPWSAASTGWTRSARPATWGRFRSSRAAGAGAAPRHCRHPRRERCRANTTATT